MRYSEEELRLRFKDVDLILKYKNKHMNNLVNERKELIKKMK